MADVMDKMDRKDASMRKSNQYVADILWLGLSESVQILTLLIAIAHECILAILQMVSYNIRSVVAHSCCAELQLGCLLFNIGEYVVELCMYMASDQQWLR